MDKPDDVVIAADDRGQSAAIVADASLGVPQRRLGVKGISLLVSYEAVSIKSAAA